MALPDSQRQWWLGRLHVPFRIPVPWLLQQRAEVLAEAAALALERLGEKEGWVGFWPGSRRCRSSEAVPG